MRQESCIRQSNVTYSYIFSVRAIARFTQRQKNEELQIPIHFDATLHWLNLAIVCQKHTFKPLIIAGITNREEPIHYYDAQATQYPRTMPPCAIADGRRRCHGRDRRTSAARGRRREQQQHWRYYSIHRTRSCPRPSIQAEQQQT